ncbi:vicilin-like seed storage protein At2g18540 isoform X2 [Punica granatum]|uniref:Vicilin-like seed storage protein At2g18540 isoform X2 n=1 Tax=Punica granatum TaxID=22663 RepID=A0A6P8E182_PUNGR|nr:vicilin-like seed storage protein At2g18540 isoform X2 [Punica granatum]
MRSFPLKLSLLNLNPLFNCATSIPSPPSLGHAMDEKMALPFCLKWSLSPPFLDAVAYSSMRFSHSRALQVGASAVETQLGLYLHENQTEEDQLNEVQINGDDDFRERERRRKIGLANKGKVPWNVGKKHSAETREKIRQRTIEALRNPKVRKKMGEHPRPHSDQIKAKIRSSLRRIWGERLKEKRLKENFYLSWWNNIAKTAKQGLGDQEELEWDSFDKIKRELALQQLKRMAEKEAAKIIAMVKAHRAAEAKAERLARLARKRKEREEKRKEREEKKKMMPKNLKENKDELQVNRLKQRLEKIHRKKAVAVQRDTTLSHMPSWEKMDLEHIKKKKVTNRLSLADQIQAARNKRAESIAQEPFLAYNSSFQ